MTNEEMQRKMEFIVEQQAQFAVNMQKLEETQARAEQRTGELEGALVTVVNLVGQLAEAQVRTDARLSQLATEVAEVAKAQKRTEAALAETSERLNSLIIVVERYFSNGRGNQSV